MTAQKDAPPRRLVRQEPHYHIFAEGRQFLVVRHAHAWRPPTDVMVDEDRVTVVVEVAGMKAGEFNVTLGDQRLIISGERVPREETHSAYNQLEIRYGEFRTEVTLPWTVDEKLIVAHYEDGFLRLELPRAKPRKVQVVDTGKPQDLEAG